MCGVCISECVSDSSHKALVCSNFLSLGRHGRGWLQTPSSLPPPLPLAHVKLVSALSCPALLLSVTRLAFLHRIERKKKADKSTKVDCRLDAAQTWLCQLCDSVVLQSGLD